MRGDGGSTVVRGEGTGDGVEAQEPGVEEGVGEMGREDGDDDRVRATRQLMDDT